MTKANEDTLDPVTNDDSLAETPRADLDPVQSQVGCDKGKRKRKPSMKKKRDAQG